MDRVREGLLLVACRKGTHLFPLLADHAHHQGDEVGGTERIEDARLLVRDESSEELRESLGIAHGGHARHRQGNVARPFLRHAEVHPVEVRIRRVGEETAVTETGAEEERLVALEVEAPLVLEHVQVPLRHEDELVRIDDPHRVGPEAGRDEEAAVQRLEGGGDRERDRHTPSTGATGSARRCSSRGSDAGSGGWRV